jgi:hypothetical protein
MIEPKDFAAVRESGPATGPRCEHVREENKRTSEPAGQYRRCCPERSLILPSD